jgi:hypothetical protein
MSGSRRVRRSPAPRHLPVPPPGRRGWAATTTQLTAAIMSLYELLQHNQDPWAGLSLFPLSLTITVTEWLRLIIAQAARPRAHND